MKTRVHHTRTLSRQAEGNYFPLVKGENLPCYRSPMYPRGALMCLLADQSRLSMSDRLTYGFKARLISLPVAQCQAARSQPKPSLTQSKASQGRRGHLVRTGHQTIVSSLSSKFPLYPPCLNASTRRMRLQQPSSEISPTVPLCLRDRSSVLCRTQRCSFKLQRRYHHNGRHSQYEARIHRIGQLHRHQR